MHGSRNHHRRLSHRWIQGSVVLAGGFALLMSGCSTLSTLKHEERSMRVAHAAGSSLSVVTANGSVKAERRATADVQIEVDLFGPDAERLDFASVHADRQGDGSLRVWVEWPGGKRRDREGAHIEVLLPDAIGVQVRSSNGGVRIGGLAGLADVHTSNGSVMVRDHSGAVDAHTSNGKLQLESVDGNIKAETSNGSVVITEAFGEVDVETSNGRVFVSTAHTNPGPVRVSTSNGSVELELGDGFTGRLRLKTSNGSVSVKDLQGATLVESSKNALQMQVGSDETISAVRTSNGSIRVLPKGD